MVTRRISKNKKVTSTSSPLLLRPVDLRHLFGTLQRKRSGQKLKDLARKGWK